MEMIVTFPGGKRVDAEFGGFTVRTDQSPAGGGEGSAPEPFQLFLASIATCAGIYALGFCQARGIPTDGVRVRQVVERDAENHGRVSRINIIVEVPPGFPEKYRDAIARAAGSCKVKKTIADPPEFVTVTQVTDAPAAAQV